MVEWFVGKIANALKPEERFVVKIEEIN